MGRIKPGDVKKRDDARDALDRVLTHAESHGEVYHGAMDDHAAIRASYFFDDEDQTKPDPTAKSDDDDDDDK